MSLSKFSLKPADCALISNEKSPNLGILVDLGLVGDVLGTVGVAEGGEGLVVVVVCGGQAGHHHRLRVPAQRVLDNNNTIYLLWCPGICNTGTALCRMFGFEPETLPQKLGVQTFEPALINTKKRCAS